MTAKIYKESACKDLLTSYVKPSLEAFLALTYVNSYGNWIRAFEDANPGLAATGNHLDRNCGEPTIGEVTVYPGRDKLFTGAVKGKGKHKGWSQAGLLLHRKMTEVIRAQRRNGSVNEFEDRVRTSLGYAGNDLEDSDDVLDLEIGADDSDDFFRDNGYGQHVGGMAAV